jgi:hypothetical protein
VFLKKLPWGKDFHFVHAPQGKDILVVSRDQNMCIGIHSAFQNPVVGIFSFNGFEMRARLDENEQIFEPFP